MMHSTGSWTSTGDVWSKTFMRARGFEARLPAEISRGHLFVVQVTACSQFIYRRHDQVVGEGCWAITRPAGGVEVSPARIGHPSIGVGTTDDVGLGKDLRSHRGSGPGSRRRQIQRRERIGCNRPPTTTKRMVTITVPLGHAALREHPLSTLRATVSFQQF